MPGHISKLIILAVDLRRVPVRSMTCKVFVTNAPWSGPFIDRASNPTAAM